jgi:hypothetical protein
LQLPKTTLPSKKIGHKQSQKTQPPPKGPHHNISPDTPKDSNTPTCTQSTPTQAQFEEILRPDYIGGEATDEDSEAEEAPLFNLDALSSDDDKDISSDDNKDLDPPIKNSQPAPDSRSSDDNKGVDPPVTNKRPASSPQTRQRTKRLKHESNAMDFELPTLQNYQSLVKDWPITRIKEFRKGKKHYPNIPHDIQAEAAAISKLYRQHIAMLAMMGEVSLLTLKKSM